MSEFKYKDLTIDELWAKVTPAEIVMQRCVNCTVMKPVDRFKGKDKTCMLCRKLISVTKTRYSHKLDLSQTTMLDMSPYDSKVYCRSCRQFLELEEFPRNSFECDICFGYRNVTEVVRIGESYDGYFSCTDCGGLVLFSEMPFGRLTCRTCINRRNGSCA